MTKPAERPDNVRVCGVEGGRVGGGPKRGSVHVRSNVERQRRDMDYRWYHRKVTDRSGGEQWRIDQRAVSEEASEVVAGAETEMAMATEATTMPEG